jgi:L-alanine-DL-glutamate epimerase-like enolase superfamily enzyme
MALKRPYEIAYIRHESIENLFVQILCTDGIDGLGAGSPSLYVTGEVIDEDVKGREDDLSEWLVGKDLRGFRGLIDEMYERYPKSPALCASIDMALHDAFCKLIDVPLVVMLGQKVNPLPTSVTIGIESVEETVAIGQEFVGEGFRIIKLKVGLDPEEDIERFIRLREAVGRKVLIRVDANQGFTPEQFTQFVEKTRKFRVEFFEQPFVPGRKDWMRALSRDLQLACAADEDLHKLDDAIDLVDGGSPYGIFNIKLMKCGGVVEALKIADIAHRRNIELMWGCMDESAISISASLQTALSCKATKYLDLDGNFDLARDIVTGGYELREGILYPMLDRPGLGVTLTT